MHQVLVVLLFLPSRSSPVTGYGGWVVHESGLIPTGLIPKHRPRSCSGRKFFTLWRKAPRSSASASAQGVLETPAGAVVSPAQRLSAPAPEPGMKWERQRNCQEIGFSQTCSTGRAAPEQLKLLRVT